ncbi:PDR/VanB family oxidoreductase [Bradyrhizobium sp. AS23.2]|uniref:PDR/VanB family oxidoreductase n=1 Tax=Bradyrhizobium sp. AS23.2 TaxID=1680155 RepID=UPI0009FB932D|nr:PDR/VanB family oxidoreductase [Bradyrhizobium sp. AS23.2]
MEELKLRVAKLSPAAEGVVVLDLRGEANQVLPSFQPGAHIELRLPIGVPRCYSLCGEPTDGDRYHVAVALAEQSRGGSSYIHRTLAAGDTLLTSPPRNNFPLVEEAASYQFIAGGIGITPIITMVRWCEQRGRAWRLLYLLRSRRNAAFLSEIETFGDKVNLHFDDEAGHLFDVESFLRGVRSDTHIYCCGPSALMEAVEKSTADRLPGHVHFEWFTQRDIAGARNESFTVVLARSGREITVAPNQSILEALEAEGINVSFSCREGLCATCETAVLAGTPEHRDQILTPAERDAGKTMMICVSRAASDSITLDL